MDPDSRTHSALPGSEARSSLSEAGTFLPGDLLANRFRITRFIAKGGMGEVFEAEDLELHEHIALKTISADRLTDARAAERFRREVHLARKITHPNVCRTYDVFKSSDPRSNREVTFVTMELLKGETLADVLRQRGSLPLPEVERILRQVGSGLSAAHRAGVVHRDFKSRNIVLVGEGENAESRAVVTDFGVALDVMSVDTTLALTSDKLQIVGTPAYMAPEQLTGGPVTVRSDLYAFGVVLFEMLTGVLPFRAETPAATALKRLSESPPDPRSYVEQIPDGWVAMVMKCLARDPSDRFGSIDSALAALGGRGLEHAWEWRRIGVFVLAGIAVAALGVLLVSMIGGDFPRTQPGENPRTTVALLGFRNLTADVEQNYISTVLREGLGTELSLASALRTVPGETVERMKVELGLTPQETLADDTLHRVHANLATDLVIVGSYLVENGEIRVFTRVQDVRTGDVVGSASTAGAERGLADLVQALGHELRRQLVPAASGTEGDRPESPYVVLPTEASVQKLYADGLDALRRFDARRARDLLEAAVARQSDFPLAHSALSAAWADLGYDAQAVRAAAAALQFSKQLPEADRTWIEALYREASREWERAVQLYEGLLEGDPGNLEYALRLSAAQVGAGRPGDARRTAERLRGTDSDPGPRVLLAEGIAAGAEGDYHAQQRIAQAAALAARSHGAPLIAARALIDEAGAQLRLGDLEKAEAVSREARSLYEDGGDRRGVARALIQLGNVQRAQGRTQIAEQTLREAVDIGRDLGNRRHTARALNDLANIYFDSRRYGLSAELYDEVLKVAREVGDRYTEARALNNLGSARYALGEVALARRLDEQALAIQRDLGNRPLIAFSLTNMAETALETGDLEAARRMYEEALTINREVPDRGEEAYAQAGLARVLACLGRTREAQAAAQEALRIRRDLGDADAVVESLAVVGFVADESGDVAVAISSLQEALQTGGESNDEIRVRAASVLTRLMLDAGDIPRAQTIFRDHVASVDRSGLSHPVQLLAAIAEGRLLATQPGSGGHNALRGAIARARKLQFHLYELQARLELARVQRRDSPDALRPQLQALLRDARRVGYASLAERATRMTSSPAGVSR
jgi:tetratricopeptide (TPR) repeat protein/tRNA A-37 threonylcarbamoyl transferase component Bud32